MDTFYWLIEGSLAGCSRPGGRGAEGQETLPGLPTPLDDDLEWLRCHGIEALLTLTETALPAETLSRHGLAHLHLPVRDMTAPDPETLRRALDFIDWQRAQGHAVAVHCLVGEGRTGTILCAYLIRNNHSPEEALSLLRAIRPTAVGVREQEQALEAFAQRRDWIL